MSQFRAFAMVAGCLCGIAPAAWAGTLSLNPAGHAASSLSAGARSAEGVGAGLRYNPTLIPSVGQTSTLAPDGITRAVSGADLSEQSFRLFAEQVVGSGDRSRAQSDGSLIFHVSKTVQFQASGELRWSGSTEVVRLYSQIRDRVTGEVMFESLQQSAGASGGTFALGGLAGGQLNQFAGSLSGMLKAGHTYEWSYHIILGRATAGAPLDAEASLQMDYQGVPLPSMAGMALSGLGVLAARRRRRAEAAE